MPKTKETKVPDDVSVTPEPGVSDPAVVDAETAPAWTTPTSDDMAKLVQDFENWLPTMRGVAINDDHLDHWKGKVARVMSPPAE